MTKIRFFRNPFRSSLSRLKTERLGLLWLCLWLSISFGFAYRHFVRAPLNEVRADSGEASITKPIRDIRVGDRVACAINPTEGFDDSLGDEVHPVAWRKIELRPDEHTKVVLLRPSWWIDERVQQGQNTMMISIPEVGIHADARIISIQPCPHIQDGDGRVVIGTFSHLAEQTINMHVEGMDEPIRCTPNHSMWSVEHGDFIEACEIEPNAHVLCQDGIRKVLRTDYVNEPDWVYNLEVHGQHVYQVTSEGVLVHNAGPLGSGSERLSRLGTSRESASRLARKAAEAEEAIGIHGVSVSAAPPTGPASSAARAEIEKVFPIHNTPARRDALHRTIELPKPVTKAIADLFNSLFGR